MDFGILGPLAVRTERGEAALGGAKPRALLTQLLLHPNQPVSAEQLALGLWGEDAPAGAVKTVQVHVSRLRKALGDGEAVTTTPAGYVLRVRPGELDAERFERLVQQGREALAHGRAEYAAGLLRDALSLWRGPPLAELAFEPFAQAEIARLREQRLAALETRVEADLAAGRHAALVGELQALAAEHPTRERLTAHLMLALYRCGRQSDALAAYQRTRLRLAGELGLEPGADLQALQTRILQHAPELAHDSDWRIAALRPSPAPREATTTSAPLPAPLRRAADAPFVGRERELEELRARWRAGAKGCVLFAGEAGIGKTRLAAELARTVDREPALVLYGRCDEGLSVPYQPFVEALRPFAGALGCAKLHAALGHHASELSRLLPELAALGTPPAADPESAQLALFEAVAALVEVATRDAPALLVLDDLHWAAGPTLLLLRHLVRSERPLRLLILGTYRDTDVEPDGALALRLADLYRDPSVSGLAIRGLEDGAIAALLDAPDAELVHTLRAQTAGNPFFIRELLRHGSAPSVPPESVRQLIGQRVARLGEPARDALRAGAVAGPAFTLALIEAVSDADALDALEHAVAAGLLTEAGPGEYAFAHALVRQTLYDDLSAARRMRLHRRIGEALEELRPQDAEALAHHFAQAAADGQATKAAGYALAAGRGAAERLGYEEAADHYERGLTALGEGHDERRRELLLALGEARWNAGERVKARAASRAAANLAERLGDAGSLARAALTFAGMQLFEDQPATAEVVGLLERALAALGEQESALRAQVMGRLAAAVAYGPVAQRRPQTARDALAMARRVAGPSELAYVLAMCQWADRGPDNIDESLERAREIAALANAVRDGRLRSLAHEWMLGHLLEQGDSAAVERERRTLERLADGLGEPKARVLATNVRAGQAHMEGRMEDCERLAHEALGLGLAEGADESAIQSFGALVASVRREQGRFTEIVEAVEAFARQQPHMAGWRAALAYVYTELGRLVEARAELDALAPDDFAAVPRDGLWPISIAQLAQVVSRLDDAPRAAVLYRLLLPLERHCIVSINVLSWGSAARSLGLLATTLGRYDEATRHFEHALEVNASLGATLWVARTRTDYARLLRRRGEHQRADEQAAAALVVAEELGLTALAAAARER
jgi:DNA-binding SARP family transcriptional activator